MIIYALEKVLYNDSVINDTEISDILRVVRDSGVEYQVGDIVFRLIDGVVVGVRKELSDLEARALLFERLWKIKPYPDWLVEISSKIDIDGPHYLYVSSGDERFSLRLELSKKAKLVFNTGNEDIYVSRYETETEGNYVVAYGEDVLENLRKAYMILKHTDLNGPLYYDTIGSLECDCETPNLSDISGLMEALKIFQEELLDVRITEEACLILRRDWKR